MERVRRHAGVVSGLYSPGEIDRLRGEWSTAEVELPIAEVTDWLQTQLGLQLTAYLAGVRDTRTVGRWRSGRVRPRTASELRLRAAYHAVHTVAGAYDARTARAWLLGSNSRPDSEAPAWLIRQAEAPAHLRLILETAWAFAEAAP